MGKAALLKSCGISGRRSESGSVFTSLRFVKTRDFAVHAAKIDLK